MKAGWEIKKLGEVCQSINGLWKGEKAPLTTAGVIRNTNFTKDGALDDSDIAYLEVEVKKLAKRQLQAGDLILEKSGGGPKQPVGRVVIFEQTDGVFSFSNFTSALRINDRTKVEPRFLHKYLHWQYMSGVTERMQSHSTGIRNLDFDAYKEIPIPIPPLSEQAHIVGILDEAFASIATAKANTQKNLENAKAVFESHLNSVFSNRGEGWVEKKLGEVVDLLTGFAFRSTQYTDEQDGIRLLRGDNIVQGALRWDGVKKWSSKDTLPYANYLLHEGDVVIAMDRPWVKAGLKRAQLSDSDVPCLLVQRTACLRVKKNGNARFLFHRISASDFISHILGVQTGLGVPHVSGSQILSFRLLLPSVEQQEAIAERLDSLSEETSRLTSLYTQKLSALEDLKKSLLHQAFTGRL